MAEAWTVKDRNGRLIARYLCEARHDVERLVLPIHYDAGRLLAERAYRQNFERLLAYVLEREGWTIVPVALAERHPAAARSAAA